MLIYGNNRQIVFKDEAEKYSFIGFLANHKVVIQWEDNDLQGAWAKEGRMAFTSDCAKKYFPNLGYSAGVNGYLFRLNCNDFVQELFQIGFKKGSVQDVDGIRRNIPNAYHSDFNSWISGSV